MAPTPADLGIVVKNLEIQCDPNFLEEYMELVASMKIIIVMFSIFMLIYMMEKWLTAIRIYQANKCNHKVFAIIRVNKKPAGNNPPVINDGSASLIDITHETDRAS